MAMAFRALNSSCSRVPSKIVGRAFYSTGSPTGGLVSPILNELPRPLIGEYRTGVPPSTGCKNTTRSAKLTTLPNGLRVASLTSNDLGISLGLFVGVGTRNETRANAGATHFLKFAAFNSTTNKPGYEVVRELESTGATLSSSVGREHLLFSSELTRDHVDAVLPIIGDLLHPRLAYHEVNQTEKIIKDEAERLEADPVASLLELLHRQAYRNRGLGQSLVAIKDNIHHINTESLSKFVSANYTLDQSVFVGVGVEHEELVKSVEAAFGNSTATKKQEGSNTESSKYVGGETLVPSSSKTTQVAIAFEGASFRGEAKNALALGILQHVLGSTLHGPGAGSQIGSGASSRLATNVFPSNNAATVLSTFNFSYTDSGLFGVYAETTEAPGRLAQAIVGEIAKVAKSNLSAEELARGKALFKLSVLDQGSQRTPALEFIGSQVLSNGKVSTPEEYAAHIDSITAEDVARVAKKAFASRPTFVVVGDVSHLPSSDEIASTLSNK